MRPAQAAFRTFGWSIAVGCPVLLWSFPYSFEWMSCVVRSGPRGVVRTGWIGEAVDSVGDEDFEVGGVRHWGGKGGRGLLQAG